MGCDLGHGGAGGSRPRPSFRMRRTALRGPVPGHALPPSVVAAQPGCDETLKTLAGRVYRSESPRRRGVSAARRARRETRKERLPLLAGAGIMLLPRCPAAPALAAGSLELRPRSRNWPSRPWRGRGRRRRTLRCREGAPGVLPLPVRRDRHAGAVGEGPGRRCVVRDGSGRCRRRSGLHGFHRSGVTALQPSRGTVAVSGQLKPPTAHLLRSTPITSLPDTRKSMLAGVDIRV